MPHVVGERDFITYPEMYKDKKVLFSCCVSNILSTSQFQCYVGMNYDSVFVVTEKTYASLYNDDGITVYGIGDDKHCGKNALGGEVCSPLVRHAFFTKP
jgi:hypothetical protein